jgi:hypothetical protein
MKTKRKKTFLYYLYCALGEKSHPHCNKTADKVAFIRLLITSQILITNFFIIANAVRHWNDNQNYEVPSHLHKNEEKIKIPAGGNFL